MFISYRILNNITLVVIVESDESFVEDRHLYQFPSHMFSKKVHNSIS